MVNSTAGMAIMSYALFTVFSEKNPTLLITVPIVFYAIMYYKHLAIIKMDGESPEKILLRDVRLQASIFLWAIVYLLMLMWDVPLIR